jgi:phosphate transport system substrate-binding protein
MATMVLSLLSLAPRAAAAEKTYTLGVLNGSNALYNLEAIDGFRKALELSQVPHRLDLVTVGADEAKARNTLLRWKQEKVDLVFAVGTEASLLAIQEEHDIPVVFIATPNPRLPGFAGSPDPSARNVTGSCPRVVTAEMLHLFKEGVPTLQRLGVVYDKGNPLSTAEVAEARDPAKGLDVQLLEAAVSRADEITPQVNKLIEENIDALWIPTDALIYENLPQIARVARPRKLPVVTSTPEGMGAWGESDAITLFAVAPDYGQLGRLSAETALDVLTAGKSPAAIPIRTTSRYVLIVNASVAAGIGYDVPPAFLTKAHKVLRGYEDQVITIASTGDSEALVKVLAQAFQKTIEGGKIEVPESVGSTGGIRALLAGKADLARVARGLSADETKAGLTCKTFAKASIAFVVHVSVTDIDNITSKEIVGIYSGTITKWNSLGAKEGRIYPVTRESGDSCLRVLHAQVPGLAAIQEPQAKVAYTTAEARDTLVGHKNTFGFVPLMVALGTDLRVLSVDGVYPSAENVRNGTYKLVIPLGIVYQQEPTGLARRFVKFLYSKEAQAIISSMGAVPVDSEGN